MSDGVNINNANFIFNQYIEANGGDKMPEDEVSNQYENFNEAVNSWYSDKNNPDRENPSLFFNYIAQSLGIGEERNEGNAQAWDALSNAIMEVSNLDADFTTITRDDLETRAISSVSADNAKPQTTSAQQTQEQSQTNNIKGFLNNLINGDKKGTYRNLDIAQIAFDLFDSGVITEDEYIQSVSGLSSSGDDLEQLAAESAKPEMSARLFLEDACLDGQCSPEYIAQVAEALYDNEALSEEEYQHLLAKLPLNVPEEQPAAQPAEEPVQEKPDSEKSVLEFMVDEFAAMVPDADKDGMAAQLKDIVNTFGDNYNTLCEKISEALRLEGEDAQRVENIMLAIYANNSNGDAITLGDLDLRVSSETVETVKPQESGSVSEEPAEVSKDTETVSEQAEAAQADAFDPKEHTTTEVMAYQLAASTGADFAELNEKITNFIETNGLSFASAQQFADELGIGVEPVQDLIAQLILSIGGDMDTVLSIDDVKAANVNAFSGIPSSEKPEETVIPSGQGQQPSTEEFNPQDHSTTEIMAQYLAPLLPNANSAELNEKITNFIEANGLSFASAQQFADALGISDVSAVENLIIGVLQATSAAADDMLAVLTLDDVLAAGKTDLIGALKEAEEKPEETAVASQGTTTEAESQTTGDITVEVSKLEPVSVNAQSGDAKTYAYRVVDKGSRNNSNPNWVQAKEEYAKLLSGGADLSECFDENGNCTAEFTKYLQDLAAKYSSTLNRHLAPNEKVSADSSAENILYAFMKNAVYGSASENKFEVPGMPSVAKSTQQAPAGQEKAADKTADKPAETKNPYKFKGKGWSSKNGCHYDSKTGEAWLQGQWWATDAIFSTPAQIIEYCYGVKPGDPDFKQIYDTLNKLNGNSFAGPNKTNGIGGKKIKLMSAKMYEEQS